MKLHENHFLQLICGGIASCHQAKLTHFVFKPKTKPSEVQKKGLQKEFFSCNGVPCVATFCANKYGNISVRVDPVSREDSLPESFVLDPIHYWDTNRLQLSMAWEQK